jgi:hypothetical protein
VRSRGTRRIGFAGRVAAACASAGLILGVSACGFDVQTLQHYQPSDGVDVNVATAANGQPDNQTIKIRGLMILAKSDTSGFLSATMTAASDDQLTAVSGTALTTDDSEGSALKVKLSGPVSLTADKAVVLTDQPAITITADKLQPGLNANLTLTFAQAGTEHVTVPILDGNNSTYSTVSPSAAANSTSNS